MKLEEIQKEWSKDSSVDLTELTNAALDLAKLHSKYHDILSKERLLLYRIEAEAKELCLEKYEFYIYGPTEEQHSKGWELPPVGKILKSDVNRYLEADKDIIAMNLKVAYQKEKIHLLESILKTISNRGFHLKTAVDYERLKVGG